MTGNFLRAIELKEESYEHNKLLSSHYNPPLGRGTLSIFNRMNWDSPLGSSVTNLSYPGYLLHLIK